MLNEQQRELVSSKLAMEKIVTEFESLREQFIEVYLQVRHVSYDNVTPDVWRETAYVNNRMT